MRLSIYFLSLHSPQLTTQMVYAYIFETGEQQFGGWTSGNESLLIDRPLDISSAIKRAIFKNGK